MCALKIPTAGISVIGRYRVAQVIDRQVVFEQFVRIDLDLVLTDIAPVTQDVGHTGNRAQLEFHQPVVDGSQLHWRFSLANEDIFINLSEAARNRPHFRIPQAFGDSFLGQLQPLKHQLAGKIDVNIVFEHDGDDGKPGFRN